MSSVRRRAERTALRLLAAGLAASALVAVLPAAAVAAVPAALGSYAGAGDQWATTGAVSSGYSLQSVLGFLSPYPGAGTVPVYGCLSGSDHFLSLNSGCEGHTVLDTEGWIYTSAPATAASNPVYLCLAATPSSEDHFASGDPHCGGQATIGLLGYTLAASPLNRYNGGVHWVTTGSVPANYALEGALGYLVAAGTGTSPLYGCAHGGDHFLALDPACEGQPTLGVEGRIYASPPPNVASYPLYRCKTSSDHFAAIDPRCEGQTTEGLLGYTLQSQVPIPPPVPAATPPPAPTTIPQPLGSAHKGRLLHVTLIFGWTWRGARTRLARAKVSHLPRAARITISCRGRGRACGARSITARVKHVRRLIRALIGRVYRAGDRIYVTVSARGYQSERAEIRVRYGKLPTVGLL